MKRRTRIFVILTALLLVLTLVFASCSPAALTAYQEAVEGGFEGTFEQWIETLTKYDSLLTAPKLEALYDEAVANGFSGDIDQWLSETYGSVQPAYSGTEQAANIALRSVVCIQGRASAGSGVIFDEDDTYAYIVTNYHVLYDESSSSKITREIYVYLYGMYYDGFGILASYVGGSMSNDIAVIKIRKNQRYSQSAASVATVADSFGITAGQTVIAAGNPNNGGVSVTSGIISIDSEYIDIDAPDELSTLNLRVIRIDAPVNPGNSGGGLFNTSGELIGIVNAKYVDDETDNIGYAIPSNIAISLAKRLLEGAIDKAYFGIMMRVTDVTSYFDPIVQRTVVEHEITVESVEGNSIAYGYLKAGDILKSFTHGGKTVEINRLYTLGDYVFNFDLGDDVIFKIERNGTEQNVTVTVTKTAALT